MGRELEARWILRAGGDVDCGVAAHEVSRVGVVMGVGGVWRCGLGVGVANIVGARVVVVVLGKVVAVLGIGVPRGFDVAGVGMVAGIRTRVGTVCGLIGDSTRLRPRSYKRQYQHFTSYYQPGTPTINSGINRHGSAALLCRRSLSFRNKREGQQEDVECRNHLEGRG